MWFWVDLVAAFPFDLLLVGTGRSGSLAWAAKRPRVRKVLRCLRIVQTFGRESFIGSSGAYMRLCAKLVLMLFCLTVLAHFHGCARSSQGDWRAALGSYYENFRWAYSAFTFGVRDYPASDRGLGRWSSSWCRSGWRSAT